MIAVSYTESTYNTSCGYPWTTQGSSTVSWPITTLTSTQPPNSPCTTPRTLSPNVHHIHHPSPIIPTNSVFTTLNPVLPTYKTDSGGFERNVSITPHSNSLNLITYEKTPSPNDSYDKYYQKSDASGFSYNEKTPSPVLQNDKATPSPPNTLENSSHDSPVLTNYSAASIISDYESKTKSPSRENSPNIVTYWQQHPHQQVSENSVYSISYDYPGQDYSNVTSISHDYQLDIYRSEENNYKEKIQYGESIFRNNNEFRIPKPEEEEDYEQKRVEDDQIRNKSKIEHDDESTQANSWTGLNQ